MFKLDNNFLISLGLGNLPVEEKNRLLQVIYERLEMNVGMRLAEKMTDQQLDEFEGFIDRNDEAGALRWLETNFPNYKDVVAEELEKLKSEVAASAPQIIAASQSGPAPANAQPAPQPQYQQAPPAPAAPAYDQPMQSPVAPPQPSYSQPPVPQQQPMPQPAPQPQYQQAPPAPAAPAYDQPAPQPQYVQSPQQQPQQFQPAPGFGAPQPDQQGTSYQQPTADSPQA